jgi:hypothetical protein
MQPSMQFKRHQLESVLHAVLNGAPRHARDRFGQEVSRQFRVQMKRLLEIDRNWGSANEHRLAEFGMAFYDRLPSGTGHDVSYSAARAFNLAVALVLVRFGFKQGEVVEAVALLGDKLRQAFERATATVAAHGRHKETEEKTVLLPKVRTSLGSGKRADPLIFLVIRRVEASTRTAVQSDGAIHAGEMLIDHEVCHGWDKLNTFLQSEIPKEMNSVFLIELSELAIRIVELLQLQPVRRRGRP